MAETKYDKYFLKEPFGKGGHAPLWTADGAKDFEGAGFSFRMHFLHEPFLMIKDAHKHDFEQFLIFIGADPKNPKDFGAEVEFSIEGEKHIITATTVVHVPPGLVHAPLNFKRIDRPIIFIDALLSAAYARK
jgi:hypothetical protein